MTNGLPSWETLPLPQQVAQMIVVRASGHLFDHQIEYPIWEPPVHILRRWVQELGVGGVILLGGSAAEVRLRTAQLQDWAEIPLLIAADIEEGVGQRFAGGTWFPPPMALNAIAQRDIDRAIHYAEQMGSATAQEALAIGINWVLAPVVDVNNNPDNPVINVRAFGDTPETVSQLTTAFIRGAQHHAVLTTAKHFPGHGDTAIDSHLELPILLHDRTRLGAIEFPPFEAAIAAGVDAVITAHLQIPALDATYPATLSSTTLTGELRQRLEFSGLIVTDALVMGAITSRYGANQAPVLAVEAGADIILMPVDPEGAIRAICAAVETGQISIDRIHESLERVWRSKHQVCSPSIAGKPHTWEQILPVAVETQLVAALLAQPQTIATQTSILYDSLQVHCPDSLRVDRLRSLDQTTPRHNLILVDDIFNSPFLSKQAPAITLPRDRGYTLQLIDRHTPPILPEATPSTLLQLFIRGNPFRSHQAVLQMAQTWLQRLLQADRLHALVIYGSPYILEQLRPHLPGDVPYVFSYGQMPVAQTIALETLLNHSDPELQIESVGDRRFTD
jgi:beta-glucosidase